METRFYSPPFFSRPAEKCIVWGNKSEKRRTACREKTGKPLSVKTFPGYLALSLDPCFTVKMADEHDKMGCKIMRQTDSKQFSHKQQQRGRHFYRKNAITERVNEKCDETKLGVLVPLEILADFPKLKCCGLLWQQREYPSFCKITENG